MVQTEQDECLQVIAVGIGCIAPCIVQVSQPKNFQLAVMMVCVSLVHGCRLLCGARHLITNLQLMNAMRVARTLCVSVSY
jgi:hypothetical protein